MWETLTNLTLERPGAVALVLIPMLLNFYILFFLNFRIIPEDTSKTFAFYIRAQLIWQLKDCMYRLSATPETAYLWDNILSSGFIAAPALGLLFTLQYTGYQKIAKNILLILIIFLPALFFQSIYGHDIKSVEYKFSPFWGWYYNFRDTRFGMAIVSWIILCGLLSVILLIRFAWKSRHVHILGKQSLILTIGRSAVLFQNILAVFALGPLFQLSHMPIGSSTMGIFSLAVIVALHRYRLFQIQEPKETPQLVEYPPAARINISPDFQIIEANDFARYILNIQPMENRQVPMKDILFPDPDNLQDFTAAIGECLTGKFIENREFKIVYKDRGPVTIFLSASPIYKDNRLNNVELVWRQTEFGMKTE